LTPYVVQASAAFQVSPAAGAHPLTVFFSGSYGGASAYQWAFGDGSFGTIANPTHVYANSGTYNVALSVHLSSGTVITNAVQNCVTVT